MGVEAPVLSDSPRRDAVKSCPVGVQANATSAAATKCVRLDPTRATHVAPEGRAGR
jgi:hypothetical protein